MGVEVPFQKSGADLWLTGMFVMRPHFVDECEALGEFLGFTIWRASPSYASGCIDGVPHVHRSPVLMPFHQSDIIKRKMFFASCPKQLPRYTIGNNSNFEWSLSNSVLYPHREQPSSKDHPEWDCRYFARNVQNPAKHEWRRQPQRHGQPFIPPITLRHYKLAPVCLTFQEFHC